MRPGDGDLVGLERDAPLDADGLVVAVADAEVLGDRVTHPQPPRGGLLGVAEADVDPRRADELGHSRRRAVAPPAGPRSRAARCGSRCRPTCGRAAGGPAAADGRGTACGSGAGSRARRATATASRSRAAWACRRRSSARPVPSSRRHPTAPWPTVHRRTSPPRDVPTQAAGGGPRCARVGLRPCGTRPRARSRPRPRDAPSGCSGVLAPPPTAATSAWPRTGRTGDVVVRTACPAEVVGIEAVGAQARTQPRRVCAGDAVTHDEVVRAVVDDHLLVALGRGRLSVVARNRVPM